MNTTTVDAVGLATLVRLRAAGWSVAVHNDYRQSGQPMTFWLLTHPSGVWAKGEGENDAVALAAVEAQTRERLIPVEAYENNRREVLVRFASYLGLMLSGKPHSATAVAEEIKTLLTAPVLR